MFKLEDAFKSLQKVVGENTMVTLFTLKGTIVNEGTEVYNICANPYVSTRPDEDSPAISETLYCMKRDNNGKLLPVFSIVNPIKGWHDVKELLHKFNKIYEATKSEQYGDENHNAIAIDFVDPAMDPTFYFHDDQGRLIKELSSRKVTRHKYDDDEGTRTVESEKYMYNRESGLLDEDEYDCIELKGDQIIKILWNHANGERTIHFVEQGIDVDIALKPELVGSYKRLRNVHSEDDGRQSTNTIEYRVHENAYTPNKFNVMRTINAEFEDFMTHTQTAVEGLSYDEAKSMLSEDIDYVVFDTDKYQLNPFVGNNYSTIIYRFEYCDPDSEDKIFIRMTGYAGGLSNIYELQRIDIDYYHLGIHTSVSSSNDNIILTKIRFEDISYEILDTVTPTDIIKSLIDCYNKAKPDLEEDLKRRDRMEIPDIEYLVHETCGEVSLCIGKSDDTIMFSSYMHPMSANPYTDRYNDRTDITDKSNKYSTTIFTFYDTTSYRSLIPSGTVFVNINNAEDIKLELVCKIGGSIDRFDLVPENTKEDIETWETMIRKELLSKRSTSDSGQNTPQKITFTKK